MNEWHGTVGHAYTLKSQFADAQLPLIRINSSIDPYCTLVVGKVDGLSESLVRRNNSMNSRNTLALAEFPLKRDVATDCRSQGPMSQQNTDDSGRNELHPQKLMQLVGFRDPNARKHEGAASVVAVLASAA
jgi:hypothetical protein